jgi:hypothetical protein
VLVSDGVKVTYALEEDRSRKGEKFRPTVYMERVSVKLEGEIEARSKNWVEENVTGKANPIRAALERTRLTLHRTSSPTSSPHWPQWT